MKEQLIESLIVCAEIIYAKDEDDTILNELQTELTVFDNMIRDMVDAEDIDTVIKIHKEALEYIRTSILFNL